MTEEIRQGDALARLREMPANSVQCVITSPPYFGLRDYGTDVWEGGDPECQHSSGRGSNVKQTKHPNADGYPAGAPHRGGGGNVCENCGARRVRPWTGGDPECDHVKGEMRRGINLAQSVYSTRGGAKKIAEVEHIHYDQVCGKCGATREQPWIGGDPDCDHLPDDTEHQKQGETSLRAGRSNVEAQRNDNFRVRVVGNAPSAKSTLTTNNGAGPRPGDKYHADQIREVVLQCGKCGARRADSQVGLEPSPEEYVDRLVLIFREVRRVLRDDGVLWLNLGDSYNAYNGNAGQGGPVGLTQSAERPRLPSGYGLTAKGLKPKDLMGIPWMVAFALRADGWYLRSDVIWAKPNPMPESVLDRPTNAHEHVFLLTKSARYFYDAEAIREPAKDWSRGGPGTGIQETFHYGAGNGGNAGLSDLAARYKSQGGGFSRKYAEAQPNHGAMRLERPDVVGRNKRNVWEIATQPYAEAHFATFPTKLVEPCLLAGSSPKACGQCGAPWRRVIVSTGAVNERKREDIGTVRLSSEGWRRDTNSGDADGARGLSGATYQPQRAATGAWEPTCDCCPKTCSACAAPWQRTVERGELAGEARIQPGPRPAADERGVSASGLARTNGRTWRESDTVVWNATCDCDAPPTEADDSGRCIVLDPFAGSGTVGVVARWYGRDFVGLELNGDYCRMARRRILLEGHPGRRAETVDQIPGQLALDL